MTPSRVPKIIHYCWFGDKELSHDELSCIDSWKRYLPDYEIIRWDESNFDIGCCDYVKEAYKAGKWAFVSDYVRFRVLYDYGGLYFDTDVEVVKPMEDIVTRGPFMGFETDCSQTNGLGTVAPGLGLGALPQMDVYKKIIASYETDHFDSDVGAHDQYTVVKRVTTILEYEGLTNQLGIQRVAGLYIYPAEYFNPKDFFTGEVRITKNTYSIHHFGKSWFSAEEKFEYAVASWLYKRGFHGTVVGKLSAAVALLRYADITRLRKAIGKRVNIVLSNSQPNG